MNKPKQPQEGWERKFENLKARKASWALDSEYDKEVKDFISKTRQEAYQEGFIAGADATGEQAEEIQAEKIQEAKEEVLREMAKDLKKVVWGHNLFEVDLNQYVKLVKKWDGTNYDIPFNDGYQQARFDILEFINKKKGK